MFVYEDRQKNVDKLRQEMYQRVKSGQAGEHLCEVATPGVVRNVNPDEAEPSK